MIGQLTKQERQGALIILAALAIVGLMMTVAGRDDPLGAHGALVIIAALAGMFTVIAQRNGFYSRTMLRHRQGAEKSLRQLPRLRRQPSRAIKCRESIDQYPCITAKM